MVPLSFIQGAQLKKKLWKSNSLCKYGDYVEGSPHCCVARGGFKHRKPSLDPSLLLLKQQYSVYCWLKTMSLHASFHLYGRIENAFLTRDVYLGMTDESTRKIKN